MQAISSGYLKIENRTLKSREILLIGMKSKASVLSHNETLFAYRFVLLYDKDTRGDRWAQEVIGVACAGGIQIITGITGNRKDVS